MQSKQSAIPSEHFKHFLLSAVEESAQIAGLFVSSIAQSLTHFVDAESKNLVEEHF